MNVALLLIILLCLVPVSAVRCELTLFIRGNITCLSDNYNNDDGCFSAECTYGVSKPYKTFALKGCGGAKTCWQMNFLCNQMHGSKVKNSSCEECDTDYCNA